MIFLALVFSLAGCGDKVPETATTQESTAGGEIKPYEDTIDWSTVSPEELWMGVSEVHDSEGPRPALLLLERGVSKGIVNDVEANQRRASYLYELGRMDEAFLALAIYALDDSHPDLLQLRAEILWSMGRYDEALRDYRVVLDSSGDTPDMQVLYQLARLYEETGDWDNADAMMKRLKENPDDPIARQYDLVEAVKSDNASKIRDAGIAAMGDGRERNPMGTFAAAYGAFLEGSNESALKIIDDYAKLYGADLNITSLKLRIDAESGDFGKFESDLRKALEDQDAIDWLDAPKDGNPHPPDYCTYIGGLLDFASALELGRGDPVKAELLAERALELNPYDHIALLQQGAISMMIDDLPAVYEKLSEARTVASPTDVRTLLRMIQFSRLTGGDVEVPWDNGEILTKLENILDVLRERYPDNAYYLSAEAEVEGYRGNIGRAVELYEMARGLPGAAREMWFRESYWMALNGDASGAFELFSSRIPSGSPDLTWAKSLDLEAEASGNESLTEFAKMVRAHLDPDNEHVAIFE